MTDDLITNRADDLVERRSAVFDPSRTYRYLLTREWGDGPVMTFVMLNPSTADAMVDDPTIRRCAGFAKREACTGIAVVNLFALRATDPKSLYSHPDPVGPDNAGFLLRALVADGGPVVAAWGLHGAFHGRGLEVARLLAPAGMGCLGVTKAGHPKHPLYVRGDTPLVPYVPRIPVAA